MVPSMVRKESWVWVLHNALWCQKEFWIWVLHNALWCHVCLRILVTNGFWNSPPAEARICTNSRRFWIRVLGKRALMSYLFSDSYLKVVHPLKLKFYVEAPSGDILYKYMYLPWVRPRLSVKIGCQPMDFRKCKQIGSFEVRLAGFAFLGY